MNRAFLHIWLIFSCLFFSKQRCFAQIEVIENEKVFVPKKELLDIKIINNTILVPLDIGNGLKVYFILDSGAYTTIITDPIIADLLRLEYIREITLKGYGEDPPVEAEVMNGFSYQLPGELRTKPSQVVVLKKAIPLEQILGEPVYGIIGYSFFKNYDVRIYFLRKQIEVFEPNTRSIGKSYHKVDIELIGGKPYIPTKILHHDELDSLKMLIDTGFSGAVNFFPHNEEVLNDQDERIENYVGVGLNGRVRSTLFKTDWIRLGNTCIPRVTANLLDSLSIININTTEYSDGSIGTSVLKRFNVIFDYANKAIYFKSKAGYQDPFYYNASGIRVIEHHDSIKVSSVREGSAAELAGIQQNDILLRVDRKAISRQSITKIYEQLNDFNRPFRQLLVLRNEEEIEFEFTIDDDLK